MAAERLSMRKIREVLRLSAASLSGRAIAVSLAIAHSTVREYRQRAEAAGVSWAVAETLTDREIEARLFPPVVRAASEPRPLPDWRMIHEELKRKRKTGVTLYLLWHEYKEAHPDGLQYSQFCELYRRWRGGLDRVLRQEHRAGEKVFVDFAGQTVPIVDRETGEISNAQIFVGVLGASSYTYAEACASQELPEWIGAHARMFEYFGGVPAVVVPDNLRAGVRHACFYEPDLNPTYHEMAVHYGTVVMPARKRKPRDKAKAEAGVLLVERWVLACLRHRTFFSLGELNAEIRRLLERLNTRPFQKLEGSRRSLFESLDRPALLPLPAVRYEFAQWKVARVNIDYHIGVLGHYYSVPYQLVRAQVHVRITRSAVEILHEGRRIAAHARSDRKGRFTTDPAHRPKAHQRHLEWTPSRIIRWAEQTGPNTAALAERILQARPHPEQGYRSCLGLLRLGERFGRERLEAACARALRVNATSYRSVHSILQHGLAQLPADEQTSLALPQNHDNIRGADYYAAATGGL
jgi:transposase